MNGMLLLKCASTKNKQLLITFIGILLTKNNSENLTQSSKWEPHPQKNNDCYLQLGLILLCMS